MAKIEMDLSEYEAIQENKKLLEKALEREQTLNDEVIRLNKEKVELLTSNEKVVTIINRVDTSEQVYSYKSMHEIMRSLQMYFSNGNSHINRHGIPYDGADTNAILDTFFEKKIHTYNSEPMITSRGLDEHIGKIKDEYFETLSQETKDDLKRLKEVRANYRKVSDENKSLTKKLKISTESIERATDQSEKLSEYWRDLSNYKIRIEEFMTSLNHRLETKVGVFSVSKFKTSVDDLIKAWYKVDADAAEKEALLEEAIIKVRRESK